MERDNQRIRHFRLKNRRQDTSHCHFVEGLTAYLLDTTLGRLFPFVDQKAHMRRFLLLALVGLAGCKNPPPPAPEPKAAVRIDAPGVNIRVHEDGGVKVFDSSGRSGVPTIVVPGN
jgi:hypothetical protein